MSSHFLQKWSLWGIVYPDWQHTISMGVKTKLLSINNYLFLFYTASFCGFLWEVLLYLIQEHRFCNRGFFYGPWLPIYGVGAVIIYFFLHNQKKHPVRCFLYSGIIGAAVELLTGWFLLTFFHTRYWDYTRQFLNLGGYICLYSILGFALAGTILICFAVPPLLRLWCLLPLRLRLNLIALLVLLSAIDTAAALIVPNNQFTVHSIPLIVP